MKEIIIIISVLVIFFGITYLIINSPDNIKSKINLWGIKFEIEKEVKK